MADAFACFDRADLLKIAGNSVRALSTVDSVLDEPCDHFGFEAASLGDMRELTARMAASVALLTEDPASFDSVAHRQMVNDYEAAIEQGLRTVTDMAGFSAALEERMRDRMGGGSISTALFEGESLSALEVDGKRAWATRVHRDNETDDIGFVQKRDGWKIKLFAKRPQR